MLAATAILAAAFGCSQVVAREVYAHFMLSNTLQYAANDYASEIRAAASAGIDGFAVNMGANDVTSNIEKASALFSAAEDENFKIFFSFDYWGNGVWDKSQVLDFLNEFTSSSAYAKRENQPICSTFEGADQSGDWNDIKAQSNCFFIPDYSSQGAEAAWSLDVADGLFSWGAWPEGPNRMNTDTDTWYMNTLGGAPFMMPISPWFYTNMPNFDGGKNWVWSSDFLWFDRWNQILDLSPEYVQILTWNDVGESHYIGPLDERTFEIFQHGGSPYNYVENLPHDGWRKFLPYLIGMYKNGQASVEEGLTSWYRLTPGNVCDNGGTVGNSANQNQDTYPPGEILQDRVMFAALLESEAEVRVSIGGDEREAEWDIAPGGSGIYYGAAPFDGRTGEVRVTVSRGGNTVAEMTGADITTDCSASSGYTRWNAWVGTSD